MTPQPIARPKNYKAPKSKAPKPIPRPANYQEPQGPHPIPRPASQTPKAPAPYKPGDDRGGKSTVPLNPQPGQKGWAAFTAARWHKNNPTAGKGGGAPPGGATTTTAATPPEDPIMTMFRSTLEQIKANSTPIDETLIRQPFRDSQVVANGLGQGLAAAEQDNYGKTQGQLTSARDEANASAARYGTATGAGPGQVNPADSQGDTLLAQQSQAQQNAAVGASRAWSDLLERLGTAAVSKAQLDRQGGIDQASMSLAASLPSMYQARDSLDLQRDTAQANNRYLLSSLDAKQRQFYQQDSTTRRGQDVSAANNKRSVTGANDRSDASINAANTRNAATIAGANSRNAATIKGAATRAKVAAKAGVKGVSEAVKAITPGTVKDSRKIVGYWVIYPVDQTGINAGGSPLRQFVNDPKTATTPEGYLPNKVGKPEYSPAGVSKNTGVTLAMWNKGVGILRVQNGWTLAQARAQMQKISPKPPK